MKAIAKHSCIVTLYVDLNSFSFNTMLVNEGEVLEFPVYEDKELLLDMEIKHLGNRTVVFQDGMYLIPTYSKDFDYID